MNRRYFHALLLLAAIIMVDGLKAAVIPGVIVQSVSSDFVNGADQRRATNLLTPVGCLAKSFAIPHPVRCG